MRIFSTLFVLVLLVSLGSRIVELSHELSAPRGNPWPNWVWVSEPWTGSDKPFVDLRKKIDNQAIKTSTNGWYSFVNGHYGKAKQNPKSATAQFGWGYAVLVAMSKGYKPNGDIERLKYDLNVALHNATPPRSYRYSRLRFLIADWWQGADELRPLGERLLVRNPKDLVIKGYLVKMFDQSDDKQHAKAVRYGKEVIAAKPRDGYAWGNLSFAHWRRSRHTNKLIDAEKAYAAAQKSLLFTPKSASNYKSTVDFVNAVKRTRDRMKAQ